MAVAFFAGVCFFLGHSVASTSWPSVSRAVSGYLRLQNLKKALASVLQPLGLFLLICAQLTATRVGSYIVSGASGGRLVTAASAASEISIDALAQHDLGQ